MKNESDPSKCSGIVSNGNTKRKTLPCKIPFDVERPKLNKKAHLILNAIKNDMCCNLYPAA